MPRTIEYWRMRSSIASLGTPSLAKAISQLLKLSAALGVDLVISAEGVRAINLPSVNSLGYSTTTFFSKVGGSRTMALPISTQDSDCECNRWGSAFANLEPLHP